MAQDKWSFVELERSGGQVPTFRPKFRIEAKDLSEEERGSLDRLLKNSDFFNQPSRFSETGHPDTFEYRLTCDWDGQTHTVVLHDQDGHPATLDALVEWILDHKS